MRSLPIAALFLVLAMRADSASRYCTFRVPIAADDRDESVLAQPICSLTPRSVFLEENAWLSERDVTSITRIARRTAPTPRRSSSMTTGAPVLDTLRVERCGSYLFVFVNGQPLTELQVDHRVSEGDINLPSGVTESDARLMNRDWKLIGGRKKR